MAAIVAKVQRKTTSVARELVRFSGWSIDGGVTFLALFSEAFFGVEE